jgi:hypothetical protein
VGAGFDEETGVAVGGEFHGEEGKMTNVQ